MKSILDVFPSRNGVYPVESTEVFTAAEISKARNLDLSAVSRLLRRKLEAGEIEVAQKWTPAGRVAKAYKLSGQTKVVI